MPAADTKAQILDVALALFNETGSGSVTTNQIAEAAGRSPGNLYYHFRNKEEIALRLLERLIARWDIIYSLPGDAMPTIADLERMLGQNFAALWDYRFIYRDLQGLQRDPAFRTRYIAARENGFAGFRGLLSAFAAAGVIHPPETETEIDELADILWVIGDYWLAYLEAGGKPVTAKDLDRGTALFRRVLTPYLRSPSK